MKNESKLRTIWETVVQEHERHDGGLNKIAGPDAEKI